LGKFTTASAIADDQNIQDIINFWSVTGAQQLLLLGQDYLYSADTISGYTKVYDEWDIGGRITIDGSPTPSAVVTGVRTLFSSAGVAAGDILIIDYSGTKVYKVIQSVDSETQITLTTTVAVDYTKVQFRISRLIRNGNPFFTDWAVISGGAPKVLIADGTYPLRAYNGSILNAHKTTMSGTISCAASTTVTGVGTDFINNGVEAGDLIVLDYAGASTDPEVKKILTVDSATQVTLTSAASATHTTKTYLIVKLTNPIPICVAYHKDRVWIGDTVEAGSTLKQRIRWTPVLDLANFTKGGYLDLPYTQGRLKRLVPLGELLVAYFDDAVFLGRPTNLPGLPLSFQRVETGGVGLLGMKAVTPFLDVHFFVGQDNVYMLSAQGIKGIGDAVVKRMLKNVSASQHWFIQAAVDHVNDRVIFGIPLNGDEIGELWSYNYRNGAWTYDKVTCHAISADAFSTVRTWENWVTTAYAVGTVTGVLDDATLEGAGTTWSAGVCAAGDYVLIDTDGDGNFEFVTTVASRTDNDTLEMTDPATSNFSGASYRLVKSTGTWEAGSIVSYPTWEAAFGSGTTLRSVYVGIGGDLWLYQDGTADDNGTAITAIVETGDYDFDLPDNDKFVRTLTLKLETWNDTGVDITFAVQGSVDRGQNWKNLGNLIIAANKDEGKVDFMLTGSICRFKLTVTADVAPFILSEAIVRARVLGTEVPGRSDA
jgi:hypothetical protein